VAGAVKQGVKGVGWSEVREALGAAVEAGVMPGAALLVRRADQVLFEGAFGARSLVPQRTPLRLETVFDLSSLTKPLATGVAVMLLVCEGKLKLEDRVTRLFHNFGVYGKGKVTFRHLLAHCSGLPAWRPFYLDVAAEERRGRVNFMASRSAKEFVFDAIHRERLEAPPATVAIYSDLNFMLLGEAVEKITGTTLDRLCRDRIFRPLGLRTSGFVDITLMRSRRLEPVAEMFAPTSFCALRKRISLGEVEDENAYAMGGVVGHAGLFAPVREVDRLAWELVRCYAGQSDFLPAALVREFWRRDGAVPASTWALGWDTPSPGTSSAGRHFSPAAVGHLGFTGTSIWIEPERQIVVSLLTNRVHPRRDNERIRNFRPLLHDLVMEAIEQAP
jgi:CubicO group peptidase (beta-lactamase class C family)